MGLRKFFVAKGFFLPIFLLAQLACVHAAENPKEILGNSSSPEVSAIPVTREDLQKISADKLPEEVRRELAAPAPTSHESPLTGSKNTWFDYLLVTVRSSMNGASITAGFMINMGAPFHMAIIPGLLGSGMSGALQLYHPAFSHWLEHKSKLNNWYDLRGIFRVAPNEKASFIESFFMKEFAVGIVYLNAIQILSAAIKIHHEMFSVRPTESAFLGLMSEGVWYVLIAHLTEKLVNKFPSRSEFTWRISKTAAVLVSIISTFGSVMFLMNKSWAPAIMGGLGVAGAITYGVTHEKTLSFARKTKSFCRDALSSLLRD
ncbi:MAG: hypothetical protein JWQ35_1146 [Bacteriovoracaceae bacterium]|nr:hypothetical protein [Bacteriovoracaceae bacterium]